MLKTGKNKLQMVLQLILPLVLLSVTLPAIGKQAQSASNAKDQFTPLIHSVEGPDLFQSYCTSCHGPEAKGAGLAARKLKAKVPDLTLLSANNQGKFPLLRVRQVIMGDVAAAAHGSREMPVWGPIFHQVEEDVDWGNVRLYNLVEYLQSIQSVPDSSVPSGAELYEEHCAVCHGSDLKGNAAPVPAPFRRPPDLTSLSRRHGGNFPEAFVSDVLRNGVLMPEHGAADMPIWGADFALDRSGKPQVESRIANLIGYIKSHQVK